MMIVHNAQSQGKYGRLTVFGLSNRILLPGIALLLVVLGGCAQPKKEVVWTAPPQVSWQHLGVQSSPNTERGYAIRVSQPTRGLFPAALAVSRMALQDDVGVVGEVSVLHPILLRDPRNEFLQWNSAFDDQLAVSEVFPIAHRNLGGGPASVSQMLAAMRALGARLGLIYAVNPLNPTQTEMRGALFDTESAQLLATFQAEAVSVPPPEGQTEPEGDAWDTDSRSLVRDRFAGMVHACVHELIAADQPAEVQTPEGWVPTGPIRPVVWPPNTYQPVP